MAVKEKRLLSEIPAKAARQKALRARRSLRPIPIKVINTLDPETDEVIAAYFHIRKGRAHETKVIRDGLLNADYDEHGNLLGVEMLGPCSQSVLRRLPEKVVARQIFHMLPSDFVAAQR